MKNNPLIVQLASLSRKEMTRFVEFANSPYFNKHLQVRALAEYLSEIYPNFTDKKCERTFIFQKLNPGQPHQQSQLAIIFTYSIRLLEQFLIVESLAEEGRLEDKTLYFSQLRKRNLTNQLKTDWESKNENRTVETSEADGKSSQFYEKRIRTATEQDAIAMQLGRTETQFLEEKQAYLDGYYLSESLRDACERIQRYRLLKTSPPAFAFFEKTREALIEMPETIRQTPSIDVYFQLYALLKTDELSQFPVCKATIREHENHFDREELQNLYNYLQNFCIQQINNGHQQFLGEIFKLYQLQLDSQLLFVDGVLPEWHYKNIVTTGLRLEERAWVRDFIEKYSSMLAESVAGNAYSYNLAAWFYHVGKPEEVLPLLLQVEYTDLRYNLDAKSLLLRTYFDLEEEGALLAHADAFSQFVKRNKSLTDFQKKGYFNLIRFSQRAFKLKIKQDFAKQQKLEEGLQKLVADIGKTEPIFNRTWLEIKLKELRG
ncbi:MAG: hypothetical protein K9J37_08330 [Saprospiraceae bacterium]|nr:hypothetical protein [Saprospiraceae bacterium]MCF8249907.1 hypothetical protein [Saprospiraceae bacterium]MCF8279320.1 hypothetical protein [Bacteroidales bacterium]MCF8310011.1 hypothetical protein [Saprospiraceae bacterium]MCF8438911.1 hypothetical protein [Saprospiraceae bacterium]